MKIGLCAHDERKVLMQNFCVAYKGILSKNELYATGTTGRMIEEASGLDVHKLLDGLLGGENQLAVQLENYEIEFVIFLRDPFTARADEPDVNLVVSMCDRYNIPLATNLASAELLIKALDQGDLDWRETVK